MKKTLIIFLSGLCLLLVMFALEASAGSTKTGELIFTIRSDNEARLAAPFTLSKSGKKIVSGKGSLNLNLAPGQYKMQLGSLKGYKIQRAFAKNSITKKDTVLKTKNNIVPFSIKSGQATEIEVVYEGSVKALVVAKRVSVVDIKSSQGTFAGRYLKTWKQPRHWTSRLRTALLPLSASGLPSYSDYMNDGADIYVEERSDEALQTINEILCMMAQTKYDSMLNLGDYKAQIDVSQCKSKKNDAAAAGEASMNQSSGSNMPDYNMWTMNASRADNKAPLIGKTWIHENMDGTNQLIEVKTTITEGMSGNNPYGIFGMNFKAYPMNGDLVDTSRVNMKGFMKTEKDAGSDQVLLKFVDSFSDPQMGGSMSEKVALSRAKDGAGGGGTIMTTLSTRKGDKSEQFNVAFDTDRFLRNSGSGDKCFSRADFDETSMRYGLYQSSDGGRVNRSSGFPVKTTFNGQEYFGWIGYWGVWFPEDVDITNGAAVNKLEFGPNGNSGEELTVLKANGKLKKHTKKSLNLGDIRNIPLQYHSDQDNKNYRVEWDGTNLNKVAKMNEGTWMWEDISPPEQLILGQENPFFGFWSEALGGSGFINLNNPETGESAALSDSTEVVFYLEDLVYPSDPVPDSLVCFERCPDPDNITGADPYFSQSIMGTEGNYSQQAVSPSEALNFPYSFKRDTMLLETNRKEVVLGKVNRSADQGVMSGPLIEPSQDNLDKLACNWDPNSTCAYQAWSLNVFYTWETGPNQWNQFTALKDSSGNFLTFDPPLSVKYIHTWADNTTSTFNLEYNGFGDLVGVPGKCVDWNTGEDVNCGQGGDIRWIPEFSIPDGSTVLDGSDSQTTYFVKGIEKERRMKALDLAECSSLSTTSYPLPSLDDWEDPAIGDEPQVDKAPAVIGGVVQ
ncbi:MAG: hypothetical protein HZA01_10330 [Nitrospinae bacterium]|nr:hypothetical protein [Nitrospinota bacterium]